MKDDPNLKSFNTEKEHVCFGEQCNVGKCDGYTRGAEST